MNVAEAYIGRPRIITYTWSKFCNVANVLVTAMKKVVGLRTGNVTLGH